MQEEMYEEMYKVLFRAGTKAIELIKAGEQAKAFQLLKQAQIDAEEIYISAED